MALTQKSPSSTYKDLLYIDNYNAGIPTTIAQVRSGNGKVSSVQLADDGLLVKPVNDDGSTKPFEIQDSSGTALFSIDNSGTVTGSCLLDEDTMASNSNTQIATQQSIKAYVDAYARSFYISYGFIARLTASNLYILGSGNSSQVHATGATSLTSLDGEALIHGTVFQATQTTKLVGCTGWIGTTGTVDDLAINFLITNALTSDQAGNFTTANAGTVTQEGTLTTNDAYYVTRSINRTMAVSENLLLGATISDGTSQDVSGSLTLEFKFIA